MRFMEQFLFSVFFIRLMLTAVQTYLMVCSLLFLSISLKTALPNLDSSLRYLLYLQCKTTLLTTHIFFSFFLAQERTQNNMRD